MLYLFIFLALELQRIQYRKEIGVHICSHNMHHTGSIMRGSYFSGKLDSSALKTGFLSTLERFAPPRDIALEEPDISNPGMIL